MGEIASNYNMSYAKLKEYLSGWIVIEEHDTSLANGKRCRQIINKLHPEEVMFSHEYYKNENFDDNSIVGTIEITDYYLSMMINQIVGFDIQSGDFAIGDQSTSEK